MLRIPYKRELLLKYHTMITTKRTAVLIVAMSLLGTVAPAAFAQNTSVNTDDDVVKQKNKIEQEQTAVNFAAAGGSGDGKDHHDECKDHHDDGKDHHDDGKDHHDDGKDHDDWGKDHDDCGKDHDNRGGDVIAGNNAVAASFQSQSATASNTNDDNDDFTTTQVDICAFVFVAIIC
jgi:hypothetical protein